MKRVLVVGSIVALAGVSACASPPQEAVAAAEAALAQAQTAGASEYAPVAFAEAESHQAELKAELAAQDAKFALTRSYERSATLAAGAKAAAEKAMAEAAAGKTRAREEANTLVADARAALDEARALLETAPRGKGSAADIEAMKADLQGVQSTLDEAGGAITAEKYLDAKVKAESARAAADAVKASVQQAMEARKAGRRRG